MPKLTILKGPDAGSEFPITQTSVIGRGAMVEISLEDPTISRRHAMLTWEQDDCFASDLGSGNGTYVNGERIDEPTRLRDGDIVEVGSTVAEFNADRAPQMATHEQTSVHVVDSVPEDSQIVLAMDAGQAGADHFGETEGEDLLRMMSRRIRFFNELSKVASETFDEETLLSFVIDHLFDAIPQAERAIISLWDAEKDQLVTHAGRTRSDEETAIAVSRTLLEEVMRRREGFLLVESSTDEDYARSKSMYSIGIRSAICAPVISHDEFLGVIQVDCTYAGTTFDKSDLALLLGIAALVGMFLSYSNLHERLLKRELLERDMMLARKIQQGSLPRQTPQFDGHTFSVDYSPALAVGGDLYDFLDLADGRLGIVIGDASGKGVSAALYVARLSSELRYQTARSADPVEILQRVNEAMVVEDDVGMFATLALLALDPASGEVELATAGHSLPLVRSSGGDIAEMGEAGSPPLGLDAAAVFPVYRHRLEAGDVVVLCTDGVTEAECASRDLFGEERLRHAISSGATVAEVKSAVLSAVKGFAGGAPQSDDLTLLCFGRE